MNEAIIRKFFQIGCQRVPVLPPMLRMLPAHRHVRHPGKTGLVASLTRKWFCWIARYGRFKEPIYRTNSYSVGGKTFQLKVDVSDFTGCWTYFEFPNPSLVDLVQKGGNLMIDGGAHLGVYTLAAAPFFKRVMTFEPAPEVFEQLQGNIALAGATNVAAYNLALSSKFGQATLHANPLNRGGSSLDAFPEDYMSASGKAGWNTFVVDLRMLDEVADPKEKIDLMKIDVEGHESEVIKGAIQSIARDRPILYMEIATQEHFDEIRDLLPEEYILWDPRTRQRSESWVYPDTVFSISNPW